MLFGRRCNCCCFNHPCPILCSCARRRCTNEVVNPVLSESFGFFNNTAVGTIAQEDNLPLNLVQLGGGGINTNGAGAITLAAGTYQISYFASGIVPASGTVSIKLRSNAVDVPGSVISETQTVGETATVTQTMVINAPQDGAIVEVVNNSAATTFSLASVFIRRI